MRRGPAIGGHLPHVSKTALEQMSRNDRITYYQERSRILGKRAVVLMILSVTLLVVSIVLRLIVALS